MEWRSKVDISKALEIGEDENRVPEAAALAIEAFKKNGTIPPTIYGALSKAKTHTQFNTALNRIYDYADQMAIWIEG